MNIINISLSPKSCWAADEFTLFDDLPLPRSGWPNCYHE